MSEQKGISVVGIGRANPTPDLVTIHIGVSVRGDRVATTVAEAGRRAHDVIAGLLSAGVERKDVQTAAYDIRPEFDHRDGEQRLLGYRVANDLRVTLRDLDSVGAVVDGAVASAGDAATVNRLEFSVSDDEVARSEAREAAWADAVSRAGHLARLSGRSMGPVVSIVETSGDAPGPRPLARAALAESTSIEPGTETITVRLEVLFEIG